MLLLLFFTALFCATCKASSVLNVGVGIADVTGPAADVNFMGCELPYHYPFFNYIILHYYYCSSLKLTQFSTLHSTAPLPSTPPPTPSTNHSYYQML
jgi:hypothetical protein